MAVPKTKISKARKRTRSSANFKAHAPAITECAHCHAPVVSHTICGNCGFYKGVQYIESVADKKAKKSAKADAPATGAPGKQA